MQKIEIADGIEMPLLGFGTYQMMGVECAQAVNEAICAGYRLIDTAEAYGNEEAVGEGIAKSGISRNDLFLVTKVNFRSYDHVRSTVESSLDKLGTNYLDMVLLHWPFGDVYGAWRELEKLHAEGVVRAIGVSNFDPDRLIDLIEFNRITPAVNQIETNLFCQRVDERKWMQKLGVAPMAYAPLGQGNRPEMFVMPQVTALAETHGMTPAQILLRFLTQQDIATIPKSTHVAHMNENLDSIDFDLDDAEMKSLLALDRVQPNIGRASDPELVQFAMTW